MANRILVTKKVVFFLALIFGLNLTSQVEAGARQTIRFYKVNRQIQADRIKFTKKKAAKPGCHNFRKKARVYKTVQIGYSWCALYQKKGCADESIISLSQEDPNEKIDDENKPTLPDSEEEQENSANDVSVDENLTTEMTEGIAWYPVSKHKRGVKIGSWSCFLTAKEVSD